MNFNCEVNIVDAIMGAGKTQSIMNYINESNEKFLVITPFLDEITRYTMSMKPKLKLANINNFMVKEYCK